MEDKSLKRARAWDCINKEMHYNFESIWIKSGDESETPSGIIFSSDLFIPSFEKWPPEIDVNRKFIVMEWVHAIDEMSIPIYEHDLILVEEQGKESWVGVVFWGRKGCARCWNIAIIENGGLVGGCWFDRENTKFTVVGNIYENQDIVKNLIENGILRFE